MTSPALEVVTRQALDEGLWFVAQTAPEAYLQQALRELHAAVEASVGAQVSVLARLAGAALEASARARDLFVRAQADPSAAAIRHAAESAVQHAVAQTFLTAARWLEGAVVPSSGAETGADQGPNRDV